MSDPRVAAHARLLVAYSIAARPREVVSVSATSAAETLVAAIHEALLRAGACPVLRMTPQTAEETFYRAGRPHHFSALPRVDMALARLIDKSIRIRAETNTRALSDVPPGRQAAYARAARPVTDAILAKPWVLTLHPTAAYAQEAEMPLAAYEDFVYGAIRADEPDPVAAWRAVSRRQARLIAALRGADRIRIVGPDTDLRLSVRGRPFVNSDGRRNMPSGEIFSSPVDGSAEGRIAYDYPVCVNGRQVQGIRLEFRRGRVVAASAEKGEAYLLRMLRTDAGASRPGEIGIGTNERIDRFTGMILLDEKMGGTVHLALGNAYREAGGRNRSALHWDMIKDLRRGGAIYVDDRPFLKDGRFVG